MNVDYESEVEDDILHIFRKGEVGCYIPFDDSRSWCDLNAENDKMLITDSFTPRFLLFCNLISMVVVTGVQLWC